MYKSQQLKEQPTQQPSREKYVRLIKKKTNDIIKRMYLSK